MVAATGTGSANGPGAVHDGSGPGRPLSLLLCVAGGVAAAAKSPSSESAAHCALSLSGARARVLFKLGAASLRPVRPHGEEAGFKWPTDNSGLKGRCRVHECARGGLLQPPLLVPVDRGTGTAPNPVDGLGGLGTQF